MKRMALAVMLVGLLAATAAAQSPYDDDEPMGSGSSEVKLKGVRPDSELKPASILGNLMQDAAKAEGQDAPAGAMAPMAVCERCGKDWKDCKCDGHGCTFFAEWLLLQPKGADTVFAVRAPGCVAPALGGAEQIDFGGESGFKLGFAKALHEPCSEIALTWWHYESSDSADAEVTPPFVLRPAITHPALASCDDVTSVLAAASAGIDFDRLELDYRRYMDMGCWRLDCAVGFAYAELNQELRADFDTDTVELDTDSYGYGVHVGGGAEFGRGCCRAFGHIDLTLLNAHTKASFRQTDVFVGTEAESEQDLDRILPILDLQLGVAVDLTQCMVLKVGYMYSFWFNTVTVPGYISQVQGGNPNSDVDDTLTFDGVFVRLELTW